VARRRVAAIVEMPLSLRFPELVYTVVRLVVEGTHVPDSPLLFYSCAAVSASNPEKLRPAFDDHGLDSFGTSTKPRIPID